MNVTLADIAQLIDGVLSGDGSTKITGASIIRDARAGEITLADRPQLEEQLSRCEAAAVVVPAGFQPRGIPYVTVESVHDAFAQIVQHFRPRRQRQASGVSSAASVCDTASLGQDTTVCAGAAIGVAVCVGARCVIHSGVQLMDGVQLGDDVVIFPNAVLYEDTRVGNRVIIHGCAVIGSYGFGYEQSDSRHKLSAQLGYVELEDDVEVGSGTTIDRGTYGPTLIGAGTKIDNQVQIAHNCRIGKHNLICAQTGIAGSCTTGDYVIMAGQVGLKDHTTVGNRAVLGAQCGVMHNVPDGATFLGSPATPEREQFMQMAAVAKLPKMRKEFKALQRQITQLIPPQAKDAA